MWCFESDFHLAWCFQTSSTVLHISVFHSFAWIIFHVSTYHSLSIHPLINICFYFLLLLIMLLWMLCVNIWVSIFICLDIYLKMELLDHVVILGLTFWKTTKLSLSAWTIFTFLLIIPVSLYPCQYLLNNFLNYRHSRRYKVVSHSGFALYFPSN